MTLVDVEPTLCECGCGAVTNQRQIDASRLRAEGMKRVDIAEMWGVDPKTVQAYLHRKPSRFIKGHVAYATMGDAREWTCERCGSVGRSSAEIPPRFCQRRECVVRHNAMWAAIAADVKVRTDTRKQRLAAFFATRRGRVDAIMRRRRWRTPEHRAKSAAALIQYRASEKHRLERWLQRQPDDVREFIEAQANDPRNYRDVSLDKPRDYVDGGHKTLHDLMSFGSNAGQHVEWVDPVGDAVMATEDLYGEVSMYDPRFWTLAKAAAIIPADYIELCAEEAMVLYYDHTGSRFLQRPAIERLPLVPGEGEPVVATTIQTGGLFHGRGASGHRGQSVSAAGKGHDHGGKHEPLADQTLKGLRKGA